MRFGERLRELVRLFSAEHSRAGSNNLGWLAGSQSQEVEACYLQALTIARGQGARLWELRAATGLARLWHDEGKVTEARDLLAPIYGWFTEGFDTPDLKEAKALLDELCRS
ncbi:MAG: hypothetical protein JO110_21140 [Acetobacteraceae bacterium]|nr:hypothetical protein [Acetobacteraceae bacterium]